MHVPGVTLFFFLYACYISHEKGKVTEENLPYFDGHGSGWAYHIVTGDSTWMGDVEYDMVTIYMVPWIIGDM